MFGYYRDKLHGHRLKRCYDVAPVRIQQYLRAEIEYVAQQTLSGKSLLELGCGYGRVLKHLSVKTKTVFGIDVALSNIDFASHYLLGCDNYDLAVMDATNLGFADDSFDHVVCIQNGVCAFHVDISALVRESVRVVKGQGSVFFSTYSPKIWQERLEWFELQSREGLVGKIDRNKTHNGIIVCEDGFTAGTLDAERFCDEVSDIPVEVAVEEVDESSLFFILTTKGR